MSKSPLVNEVPSRTEKRDAVELERHAIRSEGVAVGERRTGHGLDLLGAGREQGLVAVAAWK